MKILKQVWKIFFWMMIAVLLIAPLGLLLEISNREMEAYQRPTMPVLRETAVGRVEQVIRQDIQEYVTVSGTFASDETVYQAIAVKTPSLIRWDVAVGDEIQEGQVLGTYRGEPVIALYSGIVQNINSYSAEDPYIKVKLLENLVLEADVSKEVLSVLKRSANITTQDGELVTLDYVSNICSTAGTYRIKMHIESDQYAYGQACEMVLYSGFRYPQVLVVDRQCVYQKETGEGNPWYIRTVTSTGEVLGEVQVEVGLVLGDMICITGVEEGTYCDAGYRAIAGGDME